jgi:hypothetical protein
MLTSPLTAPPTPLAAPSSKMRVIRSMVTDADDAATARGRYAASPPKTKPALSPYNQECHAASENVVLVVACSTNQFATEKAECKQFRMERACGPVHGSSIGPARVCTKMRRWRSRHAVIQLRLSSGDDVASVDERTDVRDGLSSHPMKRGTGSSLRRTKALRFALTGLAIQLHDSRERNGPRGKQLCGDTRNRACREHDPLFALLCMAISMIRRIGDVPSHLI